MVVMLKVASAKSACWLLPLVGTISWQRLPLMCFKPINAIGCGLFSENSSAVDLHLILWRINSTTNRSKVTVAAQRRL